MSAHEPVQVAADLCSVRRDVDGVLIFFGQRVLCDGVDGALSALPLHRISMSDGGAAKLQDLLVDLLRAPDVR